MNYPRLWQHKDTKKKYRVMPWWEALLQNGEIAQVDELGAMITQVTGKTCKIGTIFQIGYLLENEHGVWFGFNSTVVESFEDLGEWKAKKRKKKGRK